jgi:Outer membrane protein beta-barrel domain
MSRPTVVVAILGLLLACGGSTQAQSWEVSGLAGYTPSASLERRALELDRLDVRGGFTFGAQAGHSFGPRWGAEVLWTEQQSALQVETAGGKADLFTFTVDELHGNAAYHFADRDAKLRPFVFGGLGATFWGGGGLPSETKLSWALGGGVKYSPWKSFGFRGHIRYKPVILDDKAAGDFCVPFGFCQGWLHQFELIGGVVARF